MIESITNSNALIDIDKSSCGIFTYERIVIQSGTSKKIVLPYKRIINPATYINFELSYELCELGIECVWSNLNDDSSISNLLFLIRNTNSIINNQNNPLASITMSNNRIDIHPNTKFGKIYFNSLA